MTGSRPRSRAWRHVAVLAMILCVLAPHALFASPRRVTVLDGDPVLVRALDTSLSAWEVEVYPLASAGPGGSMPLAVSGARLVAENTRSDAVVWISSTDGGHALWVYDAELDHTTSRALDKGPPFDRVTAAGIALSIKTILRASAVAPPPERFGAVATTPVDSTWRVHVILGAVTRRGPLFEPRAWIGASAWPKALQRHFGVSLDFGAGPGVHATRDALSGTLVDVSARLAVAARLELARAIAAELSVGGGLHLVSFDGYVVPDRAPASVQRFDVAFEPRAGVDIGLFGDRVHVGPQLGLSYLTRSQRFYVYGQPALILDPVVLEGALRLTVALD